MQPFHLETGMEIQAETGVNRLLGGAQRLRGTGPKLSSQPGRGVVDVAVGHHLVDQPDPQRLAGVDEPPGVDQVLGAGRADQPRQPCVPPAPGMIPSRISGCPNLVLSPPTRKSAHSASSSPPPSA